MHQTEEKALIKALKSLKHAPEAGWPSPDIVERMDNRVLGYVRAQAEQSERLGFFFMLKMPEIRRFAYACAVFVFIASGAVTVAYSGGALPGDTLYGTKLAIEATQVRFTSNPASRAKIQMELAGNRLKEVRTITESNGATNGRVDKALDRFTKDVREATKSLKQAGDPEQVKSAAVEISQRAQEYKGELAELQQDQQEFVVPLEKKSARIVGLAAMERAEQALEQVEEVEVEDDVENEDGVESDALEAGEVGI